MYPAAIQVVIAVTIRLAGSVAVSLVLAGCTTLPARPASLQSPCDVHEASYECQVERYHNINVP